MFYKVPQQGKYRPQPKEIKSTGLIIICENIVEHKPTGATTDEFTYYTWLESRYSSSEYISVVEKENEKLWDTVDYLLKATGCVPPQQLN